MIHQAHAPPVAPLQLAHTGSVQVLIDPVDDEGRRVLGQLDRGCEPEARLQQGKGLDEHVVVREQLIPIVEDRLKAPNGGAMVGIIDVSPGVDEIGELPLDTQVMLLRVLQERALERLGGRETIRVDVRVLAATHRDLAEAVRAGRFRSDLYYRLNVFPVRLPPLRDRPEDIPLLVAHFAARHGARLGRSIARIDRRALGLLRWHDWPGNVRELENVVERAVILSHDGTLRVDRDALAGVASRGDIEAELRTREREAIEAALRATGGRIAGAAGAAKRLGLAPSTLEFRIKRLGIDKFTYRAGR